MKAPSILKGALVLLIAAGLLAAAPAVSLSQAPTAATQAGRSTSRTVRLTRLDGSTRILRLDGVGCPTSICSTVAIESHTEGGTSATNLDTISVINGLQGGQVHVEFRDGTARRLSVASWNRVLYVEGDAGSEKIELSELERAEFLAAPQP